MHSYIVKYVVTDKAEDLPSISMNTVDYADRSLFGENNVAYIQSTGYCQCLKEDAYTNYTRNRVSTSFYQ